MKKERYARVDEASPPPQRRASLLRVWNAFLYMLPLIAVVLGALLLVAAVFVFIAHFTSGLIASAIFLLGLCVLLRAGIRAALFPGSKWLMRKNLENNYALRLGKIIVLNLRGLRNCLEQLRDNENMDASMLRPKIEESRVMVSSVRQLFQLVQEETDLTDKQLAFYRKLTRAQKLLQHVQVDFHQDTRSLWRLCEPEDQGSSRVSHFSRNVVLLVKTPENLNSLTELVELVNEIAEDLVANVKRPRACCALLKWFSAQKFVGTLQTMRAELKLRYQGQQMWVRAEDGHKIDGMFLPCQQSLRPQSGSGELENGEFPVMILCNPNAGFYEFAYYQNEWLDYYLTMGIHVFVWNYRGFGRCKGSPTPTNICKDAEAIYHHVRQEMKFARVGVHGESLGGTVACHLARKLDVDFLFADRTFSSLDSVVRSKTNRCVMGLLKALTCCWRLQAAQNYVFARCYKVVANAHNDEIISDMSSLKNGVSRQIVSLELANFRQKKVKEAPREKQKRQNIALQPRNYIHFLQPNELTFLLQNLQKINDQILDFHALAKLFPNRPLAPGDTQKESPIGPKIRGGHMRPESSTEGIPESATGGGGGPRRKGFQSLMADHAGFPDAMGDLQIDEDDEEKEPTAEVMASRMEVLKKSPVKSDESPEQEKKRVLRERLQWLSNQSTQEMQDARKVLRKFEAKMSLMEMNSVGGLAIQILKALKAFDAAGVRLSMIMGMQKRKQRDQLKLFLLNLEVWGSFYPMKIQFFDMASSRRESKLQVSRLLKELGEVLSAWKGGEAGPVLQEFLASCEVVHHYFSRIKGYLELKRVTGGAHDHRDSEASTGASKRVPTGEDEEEVLSERGGAAGVGGEPTTEEDDDAHNTREKFLSADDLDMPRASEVLEKRAVSFSSVTEPDISRTGYLIPLSTGHHGNMGPTAKNVYEVHLQHAGMLSELIV